MLRTALDQHPDIAMSKEIAFPFDGKSQLARKDDLLKWLGRQGPEEFRGSTLHRQPYVPSKEMQEFWEIAHRHSCIISLVRDNLLRKYLSWKVVEQTRVSITSHRRTCSVVAELVDLKIFAKYCEECRESYQLVDERFPNRLTVTYESLCQNWNSAIVAIQAWIGVYPRPLETETFKQETRKLSQSISNYKEVAEVIRDWGYTHWLDD
jgi:hypothetical protein